MLGEAFGIPGGSATFPEPARPLPRQFPLVLGRRVLAVELDRHGMSNGRCSRAPIDQGASRTHWERTVHSDRQPKARGQQLTEREHFMRRGHAGPADCLPRHFDHLEIGGGFSLLNAHDTVDIDVAA